MSESLTSRRLVLVILVVWLRTETRCAVANQPEGTKAVEALLAVCSEAEVIVAEKDPKTGKVPADPELGISRFIVPDETRLRTIVRANRSLMANVKSRKALIGCAKLASHDFAPGWVDLLRSVGREFNDEVSIKIAYNIAAVHDLPLGSQQGFADLKILINKAIEAEAVQFHPGRSNGLAWLTVRDQSKWLSILETNRKVLGPGLIGAAVQTSRSTCDHTSVLKAIAKITNEPEAIAFAAEFAAGRFREELKPLEEAEELELAARNFAVQLDMPSQARILTRLGQVRWATGEGELAIDYLEKAYSILNLVYDGKHRDLANLQRLLAEIYGERNEVQRALMHYMDAVTTFMSLPADATHFLDTSEMMRLMARIHLRMGYLDDARETLVDNLFVLEEAKLTFARADIEPQKALIFRDLGLLELRRGRIDEAKRRLDAALDIQIRREGAVHPETIQTLLALGLACAQRGEPGQSEFLTREATIFLTHQYGSKHPSLVKAYANLASVYAARGDNRLAAEAIANGLKAARIGKANAKPVAADFLPVRDSVLLLALRGELSLHAANRAKEPGAKLNYLLSARDHFVLAEDVFNRFRGNMPGDDDRLVAGEDALDFYAGQLACYLQLAKLETNKTDAKAAFALAERATAQLLLKALGTSIASRLSGVPEDKRAQDKRLRLEASTTMREFNRLPYRQDQQGMSPEQQAAWEKFQQTQSEVQKFERALAKEYPGISGDEGVSVCTPEQALASLGPNEAAITFLTGTLESFAVVLVRGTNGPEITVHSLTGREALENKIITLIDPQVMDQEMGRQLGEELYDLLLVPLGDRIMGKDLVIVPTGPLCRLPFELLRAPSSGGRKYLGLARRVRYAPSLTVLALLKDRSRLIRQKPDRPLWVMANPDDASLPSLPRATVEAEAIAKVLMADAESIRIGPAARKAALLEASGSGTLKRHRILHFAVHSGFVSENIPIPGLVLGADGKASGLVDMEEIASLDINADLVVLSACSSGGGPIYGGEGIRGLTTSFLAAGGRAVIATQWPLADAGAAQFMEEFYRRLKVGAQPVDALWETRRAFALQAEPRPPSEWGAFMLVGN